MIPFKDIRNVIGLRYIGSHINPEDYKEVGIHFIFNVVEPDGETERETEEDFSDEEAMNLFYENIDKFEKKQVRCNICNHKIKNGAWMRNRHTNELHVIGHDCAKNIAHFSSQRIENARGLSIRKRRSLERLAQISKIFADNPTLEEDLQVSHRIIKDIRERLFKTGRISSKQISLVHKLASERREFEQVSEEVPSGSDINIDELAVTSIKIESEGRVSVSFYFLLEHKTGYKIYAKYASNVRDKGEKEKIKRMIGAVLTDVHFSAVRKTKDTYFGIGQRMRIDGDVKLNKELIKQVCFERNKYEEVISELTNKIKGIKTAKSIESLKAEIRTGCADTGVKRFLRVSYSSGEDIQYYTMVEFSYAVKVLFERYTTIRASIFAHISEEGGKSFVGIVDERSFNDEYEEIRQMASSSDGYEIVQEIVK